jgi:anti-sigma factor ChrR (cupin superfamily)
MQSHYHDCTETITIISGALKDGDTGKMYAADQKTVVPSFTKHKPENPHPIACWMIVDFHK